MANYTYLTASANVKPMAGKLKGIFVSSASSTPTITVYDSSATSTTQPTILGVFTPTAATSYVLPLDGAYAKNGIYVTIGGTVAATVIYE
jgi:ABC-type nitrate/sulfonate/bicarbonate transport system substrate-binding protein